MRATGALKALFARSRMFTKLGDSDFDVFVEALHHRRFVAGDQLCAQGRPGDSMAIVVSGAFRVEVERPGGKREAMEAIGPGDVIGEMTCVDPAPRSATVTAETEAEVLELDRGTLESLARQAPSIYSAVIGGIIARTSERLAVTNRRVERALARLGVQPTIPVMPVMSEAGDVVVAPRVRPEARGLRRLAGLKSFTEAELAMLVRVATPRDYPQGATLFEEGSRGESCLVLTAGSVEIVKAIDRRERRLATLHAGAVVGQIALVHDGVRQATVRTLEPVRALELSRHNFEALLIARAPLAIRFQEQVAAASIRQLRLANERLGQVLDRVDDLDVPLTVDEPPHEFVAPPRRPTTPSPSAVEELDLGEIDLETFDSSDEKPSAPSLRSRIPTEVIDLRGRDSARSTMAFIQAALSEWGMHLGDLDGMETKVPDGQVSRKETLLRERR